MRLARFLIGAGRTVLDLLLPPRCLACGTAVGEPGTLCPDCWAEITFLGAPWCRVCGTPFDEGLAGRPDDELICADCLHDPPPYDRARAVVLYDDAARGPILALKHADRTDTAPAFARWMLRAGGDLVREADLIVPVPLHLRRLIKRRYNQSALLARRLGRLSGKPVAVAALKRTRATPSQGGLGRGARKRNVKGAFAVVRPEMVRGKRVLLIDDVLTTGATVAECARVLKGAGARAVDILTVARVMRT